MQIVSALLAASTLLVSANGAAIDTRSANTCKVADIALIKHKVASPVHFCTFYLALYAFTVE